MRRDTRLLTDPVLLCAVALLLANDFVLKPLFHNALTGKLSDFAGLFAFPLFWTALLPRHKVKIHLAAAAGFVLWKSPLSQPLIEAWNGLSALPLARTVDAGDLLALPSVALSFLYHTRAARAASSTPPTGRARRWATCAAAAVAVFAFTATSFHTAYDVENQHFTFADSKDGLVERLKRITRDRDGNPYWSSGPAGEQFSMPFKADCCCDRASAVVRLYEVDARRTRLALLKLEHDCSSKEEGDEQKMLAAFMREVVSKLQDDIEASPPAPGEEAAPGRGARSR